jgi:hemin uptake protein HemP
MQKIEKDEEYYDKIRKQKEAENKEKLNQTNRRLESEFNRAETDFIKRFKGENKR